MSTVSMLSTVSIKVLKFTLSIVIILMTLPCNLNVVIAI